MIPQSLRSQMGVISRRKIFKKTVDAAALAGVFQLTQIGRAHV